VSLMGALQEGQMMVGSAKYVKGNVLMRDEKGMERTLPIKRASSFTVGDEKLLRVAVGEELRATGGGRTLDGKHRLNTGVVYKCEGFTPEGHLKLDNGWVVDRNFGRFAHGYVSTSHSVQSRTVDCVFIAQTRAGLGAASMEQVYVSVSRGRHSAGIYTDDRSAIVEASSRLSQRRSAVELLSGSSLERTREHAESLVRLRHYESLRNNDRSRARDRGRGRAYER
jgi:hypothetical protein